MAEKARNITEILEDSALGKVIRRASQLAKINQAVQEKLPHSYRGLYRIANLVDNQLIIEVQNATVLYGFQLQQTHLLNLIKMDFPEVNQLNFKVNPSFHSK